jgi:voltage-gated potassium channel Kch
MKIPGLKMPSFRMVEIIVVLILIIGWGAYLLALAGLFYRWASFLLVIAPFIFTGWLIFKKKVLATRSDWLALGIISIFLFLSFLTFEPSIFSGRDQGSISEAAIRLTKSHSIRSASPAIQTFSQIYGPGKALNFPGFYYTPNNEITTQFPLPYIAWLAVFYDVFGLVGFIIANTLLYLAAGLALFRLALHFTNFKFSVLALLFFTTTFIFSWILKMTLSENLAMALLWPAILFLVEFLEKPSSRLLSLILLASGLLFFVRIEGIAFFLIIGAILIISEPGRSMILKKDYRKKLLFLLATFLLIFILTLGENFSAYREIGKAFFSSDIFSPQASGDPTDTWGGSMIYILRIFSLYGLISFLALGSAGIISTAIKKQWQLLVPFLVVSPTFLYLFHSYISSDHPWMLRRFAFSLLPVLILYSIIFLHHYQSGKFSQANVVSAWRTTFSALVIISVFVTNLFIFSRFVFLPENRDLLPQVEKISQNFNDQDLILVDRLATGDGWTMMTGPLSLIFNKQAVYFFNPADFSKIDQGRFSNIYLVAPDENYERWISDLNLRTPDITDSYSLVTQRLEITSDPSSLPDETIKIIRGKIIKLK